MNSYSLSKASQIIRAMSGMTVGAGLLAWSATETWLGIIVGMSVGLIVAVSIHRLRRRGSGQ